MSRRHIKEKIKRIARNETVSLHPIIHCMSKEDFVHYIFLFLGNAGYSSSKLFFSQSFAQNYSFSFFYASKLNVFFKRDKEFGPVLKVTHNYQI